MKLEQIGFYTLSDSRCMTATHETTLKRCELVLTAKCNFKCPYCRSVGGEDMKYEDAKAVVDLWCDQGLENIRFSGGEPTLWKGIIDLVAHAKARGIKRIALSTNGSANTDFYTELLKAGVTDFSVSLDACCAEDGDKMAGGIKGAWEKVCKNIQYLSTLAYTTVGVVLTYENQATINNIIAFAYFLGVSDIRIIPAAQEGKKLGNITVSQDLLDKYPILAYRIDNVNKGNAVRGLKETDSHKCGLCLDDMAVNHGKHYPCIIYMRECGDAIGNFGEDVREQRLKWYQNHDTHLDPICKGNCLDVCVDYNNKHELHYDTKTTV